MTFTEKCSKCSQVWRTEISIAGGSDTWNRIWLTLEMPGSHDHKGDISTWSYTVFPKMNDSNILRKLSLLGYPHPPFSHYFLNIHFIYVTIRKREKDQILCVCCWFTTEMVVMARLNPGTKNFLQVSCVAAVAKRLTAIFCCFPR